VRWPGKTSGAIGFALNFLLLLFFVSRQRKVRILHCRKTMINGHWRTPRQKEHESFIQKLPQGFSQFAIDRATSLI
jgi:hypothetical protein